MKERYTFVTGTTMKREIIKTADGSSTLRVPEIDECYHSVNGALAESMHIFIENGLKFYTSDNLSLAGIITILEAGFGTGLNCMLSLLETYTIPKKEIHYISLELYPLDLEEVLRLNYPEILTGYTISKSEIEDLFLRIHSAPWNISTKISDGFTLTKLKTGIEELADAEYILKSYLQDNQIDIVYYDAFSPEKQPELWSNSIFKGLYHIMKTGSVLTTYSSKGVVKQALRDAGFYVLRIAGPVGKKHIVRAEKQ